MASGGVGLSVNDLPPVSRSGAGAERLGWLDTARGIGILLVVYAHVMRSLVLAGIMPDDPLTAMVDRVIYAFHMPLFFVLSGLFARTPRLGGRTRFVKDKLERIAYPYLLWSVIMVLAIGIAGGAANHRIEFSALASIGWEPIAHFWFLYVLFFCFMVLLLPGRIPILAATGIYMVVTIMMGFGPIWLRIGLFLPFFIGGFFLTAKTATAWFADGRRLAMTAMVSWAIFALLMAVTLPDGYPYGMLIVVVGWIAAFAGTMGTLAFARAIDGPFPFLQPLGIASMPIYLAHPIASAAVRALLLRLHVTMPVFGWALLLTAAGILLPYAAWWVALRLNLTGLAGFGPARGGVRLSAVKPESAF
jgi:fucose 4-O-acetylase-like acetyltransferase